MEQKIYWTDQSAGINRASVHDGLNQEQVVTKELNTTDGMAVDYNGRNIFWTDTGMNRIEVERMDGTYRKILISHGLDEPRDISLGMSLWAKFLCCWSLLFMGFFLSKLVLRKSIFRQNIK